MGENTGEKNADEKVARASMDNALWKFTKKGNREEVVEEVRVTRVFFPRWETLTNEYLYVHGNNLADDF